MDKRMTLALFILVLLILGGYILGTANDVAVPSQSTIAEQKDSEDSVANTADGVVTNASPDRDDEKRANLNMLVSTDSGIRRKALAELALELSKSPPMATGKYTTYGDDLLPVLGHVIADLDDPYAHNAVEATFYLAMVNQSRANADSLGLDASTRAELEKLSHYPRPSSYQPMKSALTTALTESRNDEVRHWAALALANGFEPTQEIEAILASQLPREIDNRKVGPAIIGALSELAERHNLQTSTQAAILNGLESSDNTTRRTAAKFIGKHRVDGGLQALFEQIPTSGDVRTLRMMLDSVVSIGVTRAGDMAELERMAAEEQEDELKIEILSALERLQGTGAR